MTTTELRPSDNRNPNVSQPVFDLSSVPVHHRDRVADMIPSPGWADQYVHRFVDGEYDFDIFDGAIEDRENIILTGPTGSSKTTAFRAYAAARGLPFSLVECNAAMDPGTVLGRTATIEGPEGEALIEYVFGDFLLTIQYGGVSLIDEVNMAHPRVTAAYHQLLAVSRRVAVPEAGTTVLGAYPLLLASAKNDRYQGVVRMSEALLNRYAIPLDWGYEREVEERLVRSKRLLDMAYNLRSLPEVRSPLSTNALQEFERHLGKYNPSFAAGCLVRRFEREERPSIRRALDANLPRILVELAAIAEGREAPPDDEGLQTAAPKEEANA